MKNTLAVLCDHRYLPFTPFHSVLRYTQKLESVSSSDIEETKARKSEFKGSRYSGCSLTCS